MNTYLKCEDCEFLTDYRSFYKKLKCQNGHNDLMINFADCMNCLEKNIECFSCYNHDCKHAKCRKCTLICEHNHTLYNFNFNTEISSVGCVRCKKEVVHGVQCYEEECLFGVCINCLNLEFNTQKCFNQKELIF